MSDIRTGKCPVCGIKVETDCGPGCSDHRNQVRATNKRKMADLREKKATKEK